VIGDDWDQDAGSGHHYRLDALRAFEADIHGFVPITIGTRESVCHHAAQHVVEEDRLVAGSFNRITIVGNVGRDPRSACRPRVIR
jgi:hypothetical protein